MSYDRTVRLPEGKAEAVALLSESDNLKPGPWMAKQILDNIDARAAELKKLKRKSAKAQ